LANLRPIGGYEVPVLGDVDVVDRIPHFPYAQELGRHVELHVRYVLVGDKPYDGKHGPGGHEEGQRIPEPGRYPPKQAGRSNRAQLAVQARIPAMIRCCRHAYNHPL